MITTRFSIACETNKMPGLPQENVFFQGAYRRPDEYLKAYARASESRDPFQVYAIFSAQGKDEVAAAALQRVMKAFGERVAKEKATPITNFEILTTQVVSELNDLVCDISLSGQGTPLRISVTALFIQKNTLNLFHLGNTRALLLNGNRISRLTEDQTVTRKYIKDGIISPAD